MEITTTIQNRLLKLLCLQNAKVAIFLKNGTRLEGHIRSFDRNIVVLDGPQPFIIYKQSISSVLPTVNYTVDAMATVDEKLETVE